MRGVPLIQELTTKEDFREVIKRGGPIVITDSTGNRYHANPWSCGHVEMDNFTTKVIVNQGKGGGYFSVANLTEARERWDSVVPCE
jgi:hypothetical protein